MYSDLAPWFHLLTHPSDYWDEAAFVTRVVDEVALGEARTLLELGLGRGEQRLSSEGALRVHAHRSLVRHARAQSNVEPRVRAPGG